MNAVIMFIFITNFNQQTISIETLPIKKNNNNNIGTNMQKKKLQISSV